jgi:peptidoglycan-associated lipoprotein
LLVFVLGACAKKQTAKVEPPPPVTEVTEQPAEPPVEQVEEAPPVVQAPVLNDVFFDFDKSTLTEQAKRILAENANQLKNGTAITIEGHCDERGTNAYNLALGERRAKAAKDYLVTLGVDVGLISTVSYGEEKPFDAGHDETAWAKNRRAHFVLTQ